MGRRMPAAIGGWMSTLFVAVSVCWHFRWHQVISLLMESRAEAFTSRCHLQPRLAEPRQFRMDPVDPLWTRSPAMMLWSSPWVVDDCLFSIGYLKGEKPVRDLFRLSGLFTLLDARIGALRNIISDLHLLGAGWCVLLPVDRILLRSPERGRGCQEGVHCYLDSPIWDS